MKARLAQRPSVVWSPAFVGLFLAVLIVFLAWPRFTGPSWRALQMPFDLRESEGNTVQWEQYQLSNALRATLRSDAGWLIEEGHYNTDHYRALLPTYISAILAYWLDSSYKGFALVDLLGWWIGAWALYYLARRLDADHLSALTAAVLLAASPLLISHMWQQAVHVAHSASLVPCFLVALLLLIDNRLLHGWRVIGLASVLYVASLAYQYQWIIVPCLLSLAVVDRRRWKLLFSIVAASTLFVLMTFLTYHSLEAAGLSVSSHSNDPLAVTTSRLSRIIDGEGSGLGRSFLESAKLLVKSYHLFIVILSMFGLMYAHSRLRILVCVGVILALVSGYFHPVPWVSMNGYPFMYISAGLALVQGPRWLAATVVRISSRRYPRFAERITAGITALARLTTAVLILLAMWSTNTDIFGDYSFVQRWWDFSYVPR